MMQRILIFCLLAGGLPRPGLAQGLVFDSVSLGDFPTMPMSDGSKNFGDNLPLKKDLSAFVPLVIAQGKQDQTCTAIATAYYAIGIQRAIEKQVNNANKIHTEFSLSPIYVFSKVKNTMGKCNEGTKLSEVAHYLENFGSIPFSVFNATTCASVDMNILDSIQAPKIKVKQVQVLFLRDSSTASDRRLRIKASIVQNRPVVVGLELFTNFTGISKQNPFYRPSEGTPVILKLPNKKRVMAGHAVTVVGFDDDINAFKMVNSYGKSWGKEGFFWMKYKDFDLHAREGIAMHLFP